MPPKPSPIPISLPRRRQQAPCIRHLPTRRPNQAPQPSSAPPFSSTPAMRCGGPFSSPAMRRRLRALAIRDVVTGRLQGGGYLTGPCAAPAGACRRCSVLDGRKDEGRLAQEPPQSSAASGGRCSCQRRQPVLPTVHAGAARSRRCCCQRRYTPPPLLQRAGYRAAILHCRCCKLPPPELQALVVQAARRRSFKRREPELQSPTAGAANA
jgi:hypothetical protein